MFQPGNYINQPWKPLEKPDHQIEMFWSMELLKEFKWVCFYYKGHATVSFTGKEVLIKDDICDKQKKEKKEIPEGEKVYGEESKRPTFGVDEEVGKDKAKPVGKVSKQLSLKFKVPKGKVSSIMGVMNLLQSKFNTLEISLSAKDGSISRQEIDDKIAETFRQLNIDFDLD